MTAITSLERALSIQENTNRMNTEHLNTKLLEVKDNSRIVHEQLMKNKVLFDNYNVTVDRVHTIVDEIIREKRLGEVNSVTMQQANAEITEYLLKQMGILGESIRMEIIMNNREEFNTIYNNMNNKINEVDTIASTLK